MPLFRTTLAIFRLLPTFLSQVSSLLTRSILAFIHKHTYKSTPHPLNVVVVGASFAGYFLARQLAHSLPTGYRVVLIERNAWFQYTWLFPRVTVVRAGHEDKAFIPYTSAPRRVPKGSFEFKVATVVSVDDKTVILEDGERVEFAFLAIATGSSPRYPAQLSGKATKSEGTAFFRSRQEEIQKAQNVVVAGGGAVGVEVALDIKSLYHEKNVTLVHSRDRLLNHFKPEMHELVMKAMDELGVQVFLGHRVAPGERADDGGIADVRLSSGQIVACDFLLPCTGQSPSSTLLSSHFPSSISPTGTILVYDTLQIRRPSTSEDDLEAKQAPPHSPITNIFALGDVAETQAPKMGRAAYSQGMVVGDNIMRLINGKKSLKRYQPGMFDGSTELTLGLEKSTLYLPLNPTGVFFKRKGDMTMHAAGAWKSFDAVPFVEPE